MIRAKLRPGFGSPIGKKEEAVYAETMKAFLVFLPALCLLCCRGETAKQRDGKIAEAGFPAESGIFPPGAEREDPSFAGGREEERIVASMDDRLLAAQVLLAGLDNRNYLSGEMKALLREIPAGGIMFFRYNLDGGNEAVRAFLAECSSYTASFSPLVPFLAVDHEGGLVHRFTSGIERLPPAFSFWDLALREGRETALKAVEETAFASGEAIRRLGITMNLAPVAEVLNGENKAFLDTRSYGPDPDFVQKAASAFIRGMDRTGIVSVVKHFPGNSGTDPHYGKAVLNLDRKGLSSLAEPFAGIIRETKPPAMMVSHILAPALDRWNIASLSPRIIEGWIRDELGFSGIVIADDFAMEGASAGEILPHEAAVRSLCSGADMVMVWPGNIAGIHRAIREALHTGLLPRRRLEEAVCRIVREKLRRGLVARLPTPGEQ
jgi:beta-N-acetylhexosaminidase